MLVYAALNPVLDLGNVLHITKSLELLTYYLVFQYWKKAKQKKQKVVVCFIYKRGTEWKQAKKFYCGKEPIKTKGQRKSYLPVSGAFSL